MEVEKEGGVLYLGKGVLLGGCGDVDEVCKVV